MRAGLYKHYALGVLTVVVLFNYVDRMALGIVLQDIKTDLHLTDTELGLLSGIAFAVFYSVMGIPIARWADRGNRVTIVAVTTALWSAAVAFSGMATNFVQLLLIRIGVAVGEAGCNPPALSLTAAYFPRAERPRAQAIYAMGGALSFMVGFSCAGWLNELYGWRVTFVVLGAPGLVLAAIAWFTLKEPRQMADSERAAHLMSMEPSAESAPSIKEVCSTLWANATFRCLLLYISVDYFFGYGIAQWQPTFFIRSFKLETGEIGLWMAVSWGLGGLLGTYLGGYWASRYAANNERLQLQVIAIVIALSTVIGGFVYRTSSPYAAFALISVFIILQYSVFGSLYATIQTLVRERMRAVAFAFIYLIANLVGLGFGPLAVGTLSDALQPWAGSESLRFALLILAPGYFCCAWLAWRASKTVMHDLAAARADLNEEARISAVVAHAK